MGDASKAEKQNLPLLKHCWSLNTCLAVKSKVDSFSSIFFFFLSLGGGREKKGGRPEVEKQPPQKKKQLWSRMCECCRGKQRRTDKTSQECWGPSSETHTVYVVLTTNQKYVPIRNGRIHSCFKIPWYFWDKWSKSDCANRVSLRAKRELWLMQNHCSSIPFHINHCPMKILWGCRTLLQYCLH